MGMSWLGRIGKVMAKVSVFDSSAFIALIPPERYSSWVDQMIVGSKTLVSLDLAVYEVSNALWKKYSKLGVLREGDVYMALEKFFEFIKTIFEIYRYSDVIEDAVRISLEHDITVYDAAYVALADRLGGTYITLDIRLKEKLDGTRYYDIILTP